jgi:hypothetical protein
MGSIGDYEKVRVANESKLVFRKRTIRTLYPRHGMSTHSPSIRTPTFDLDGQDRRERFSRFFTIRRVVTLRGLDAHTFQTPRRHWDIQRLASVRPQRQCGQMEQDSSCLQEHHMLTNGVDVLIIIGDSPHLHRTTFERNSRKTKWACTPQQTRTHDVAHYIQIVVSSIADL